MTAEQDQEVQRLTAEVSRLEGQVRKWEATANSYAADLREQEGRHRNRMAVLRAQYDGWQRRYENLVEQIVRVEATHSPTVMQIRHALECTFFEGRPDKPCTCGLESLLDRMASSVGCVRG